MRACARLLLFQKKKFSKESWDVILGLESHKEDLVGRGDEKGNMVRLMAKGAGAYSGTDLDDEEVLGVYCRVGATVRDIG